MYIFYALPVIALITFLMNSSSKKETFYIKNVQFFSWSWRFQSLKHSTSKKKNLGLLEDISSIFYILLSFLSTYMQNIFLVTNYLNSKYIPVLPVPKYIPGRNRYPRIKFNLPTMYPSQFCRESRARFLKYVVGMYYEALSNRIFFLS